MTSPRLLRTIVSGVDLADQGVVDDVGYRTVKSDTPLVQQDDPRRDLADKIEVMLNDQDA